MKFKIIFEWRAGRTAGWIMIFFNKNSRLSV